MPAGEVTPDKARRRTRRVPKEDEVASQTVPHCSIELMCSSHAGGHLGLAPDFRGIQQMRQTCQWPIEVNIKYECACQTANEDPNPASELGVWVSCGPRAPSAGPIVLFSDRDLPQRVTATNLDRVVQARLASFTQPWVRSASAATSAEIDPQPVGDRPTPSMQHLDGCR